MGRLDPEARMTCRRPPSVMPPRLAESAHWGTVFNAH